MVFVMFWMAVIAMVCFILAVVFKVLDSLFTALLFTIGRTLKYGGTTLLALVVFYLLYSLAHGIATKGIGEVLGEIFLFILGLSILFFVFAIAVGLIGGWIIQLPFTILEKVIFGFSNILKQFADMFELAYMGSLTSILKCFDKR